MQLLFPLVATITSALEFLMVEIEIQVYLLIALSTINIYICQYLLWIFLQVKLNFILFRRYAGKVKSMNHLMCISFQQISKLWSGPSCYC